MSQDASNYGMWLHACTHFLLGKSTDLYDIKHEVLLLHNIVVFYYYDSVPLDAMPWTINTQSSDHDEIETKEHNFNTDVAIILYAFASLTTHEILIAHPTTYIAGSCISTVLH